jgi:hypothetical protein
MLDIAGTYQIKSNQTRFEGNRSAPQVAVLGQAGRTAEERAELDWTEPDSPAEYRLRWLPY